MDSFDDIDSFLQNEMTDLPADTALAQTGTLDPEFYLESLSQEIDDVSTRVADFSHPDSQSARNSTSPDDIDLDFLDSVSDAPSVPVDEHNEALDLDFLAYTEIAATVVPTPDAVDQVTNSPATNDSAAESDFLAWLDAPQATSRPGVAVGIADQASGDDVEGSEEETGINDFLDEVFGDSHSSDRPVMSGAVSALLTGSKKYEAELRAETSSGFPDISTLRNMVLRGGYLPHVVRGSVWCILLTGGPFVDDQEAEFWKPQGTPSENIGNRALLEQDCTSAVKHVEGTTLSPTDTSQCREDLRDILLLYCMRRNIPYAPLMCDLLAPMMLLPPPIAPLSRALASAALYSMHTDFIPTVTLPVSPLY